MRTRLAGKGEDGSKLRAYESLMAGDLAEYHAARMDTALYGVNDPKALFKQLEGKSEWQRKQIIDAFNKRHGGGNAFLRIADDQFGAESLDAQKARLVLDTPDDPFTGLQKQLPEDFVLRYAQDSVWNRAAKTIDANVKLFDKYPSLAFLPGVAGLVGQAQTASYFMRGWGVDSDKVKDVLKGKSKEEIEELKKKYPELEADLRYCLSGRNAFEVDLMLREGVPVTAEDKVKRALALYEFDRGSAGGGGLGQKIAAGALLGPFAAFVDSGKLANRLVDQFTPSGTLLDKRAAELREQLAALKQNGSLTGEQQAHLDATLAMMDASTSTYLESRDEIVGAVATVVGAVVGAGVTLLTGGAAAPILAALATGVSQIAVKAAMLGHSYGRNELGVDIAMTMVQMATAGIQIGGDALRRCSPDHQRRHRQRRVGVRADRDHEQGRARPLGAPRAGLEGWDRRLRVGSCEHDGAEGRGARDGEARGEGLRQRGWGRREDARRLRLGRSEQRGEHVRGGDRRSEHARGQLGRRVREAEPLVRRGRVPERAQRRCGRTPAAHRADPP
ncbi:MAG: hypothetical protein IPQ07_30605 [Myxococcales bacterium]|nr:hypothetical protein [Myxococcales bacterium]